MCYARHKTAGGVGALRESVDTNFLKSDGQSRNLNVYVTHSVKLTHRNSLPIMIIIIMATVNNNKKNNLLKKRTITTSMACPKPTGGRGTGDRLLPAGRSHPFTIWSHPSFLIDTAFTITITISESKKAYLL